MSSKTTELAIISPSAENVSKICKQTGALLVSIYLPIKNEAPESDKNPIRLKQLLQSAEEELAANGMKADSIEELLAPAWQYVHNPQEMLEYSPGLALFLDTDNPCGMKVDTVKKPFVDVSNRFYVKPLIPTAFQNPSFTILCLNRGDIQAYRGNRYEIKPIKIEGMPGQLEDVTGIDDPEKSLQQHTGKTTSAEGRPGSSPAMQTHGQGLPADYESSQYERFFHEVAESVHNFLSGKKDILIVFGVEQNVGIFRDKYKWEDRDLLDKVEDPHSWNTEKLLSEAWALVRPLIKKEEDETLNQFEALANKDEGIFEIEEAAMAAATGRIDSVAVANDKEVYGICNPDKMEVRLVNKEEPGCSHDLLDYIAGETIKHGGTVISLPQERIPGSHVVAAKTRF